MDWHARYVQQARWTDQLRHYLYRKAGLSDGQQILEVGCGTGAVLGDFPSKIWVYGLDVNLDSLESAAENEPNAKLINGDGLHLPFKNATFDLVICHYLLLWVKNPQRCVAEMCRVVRPGGAVLALAEPDYGGRIDYPPELGIIGQWQKESLRQQGAEPEMGRKLAGIFSEAGLRNVETGVMGGEWIGSLPAVEQDLEWNVLSNDLDGKVTKDELENLRNLDNQSRENGERVLFVPTFFAWGVVSS